MKKRAYTLIELIFVIVIIGILTSVGFYYFKPHYLQNDKDFLELQLNTTRYQAINFDKRNSSDLNYSIGCIATDNFLKADSTIDQYYKSHANITIAEPYQDIETLCFDIYGRLHDGTDGNKTTQNSLLKQNIVITLSYNDENTTLTIDYNTGSLR